MTQTANTIRTNANSRAASLAALAALLVVLASADAAMRVSSQGVREAIEGRPQARTSVVGLGRMVEGLLACAAVPDEGRCVAPVPSADFVSEPGQVGWALPAAFGLHELMDLPPPAVA
ncbi:MAG: hypothetical protein NCW75_12590 [Phycisphaera sp.]|nr:MAG: hypothetical protein NCW75_12590 [Phycisphaera sp.]